MARLNATINRKSLSATALTTDSPNRMVQQVRQSDSKAIAGVSKPGQSEFGLTNAVTRIVTSYVPTWQHIQPIGSVTNAQVGTRAMAIINGSKHRSCVAYFEKHATRFKNAGPEQS
jgi:hypothetical protein